MTLNFCDFIIEKCVISEFQYVHNSYLNIISFLT
jgi:hypothetical protein